jgi:PTS system N-acetylglucosamine-specific IIB component
MEARMGKADEILRGLGGADNILDLEPCITRLRTEVRDPSLVDEATLKAAGAIAVMRAGRVVQVIVGPEADTLASDIDDLLEAE